MSSELLQPPERCDGRWRVHVDLEAGRSVSRADEEPADLVTRLLSLGVEVCVVDLDRSRGASSSWEVLGRLVESTPGRLWAAGGVTTAEDAELLLSRGAAGVVLGSGFLRRYRLNAAALHEVLEAASTDRLAFSIDRHGEDSLEAGFERKAGVTVGEVHRELLPHLPAETSVLHIDARATLQRHRPAGVGPEVLETYPHLMHWYGGNVASWDDVARLNRGGVGAVVGSRYLSGRLGLPAANKEER